MHVYFDVAIVGFKKPSTCKIDTPSRTNRPSSMEAPHIGWLFDECLDKSNIDDVFDEAVLENCVQRIALYLLLSTSFDCAFLRVLLRVCLPGGSTEDLDTIIQHT